LEVDLTAGTGFANDRGHLLVSGELSAEDGILINNRPWNSQPAKVLSPIRHTRPPMDSRSTFFCECRPEHLHPGRRDCLYGGIGLRSLRGIAFGPGGVPYNVASARSCRIR